MNELNLPKLDEVTEVDAGDFHFKIISVIKEDRETVLDAILSTYANEPCRICGELLTREDVDKAVFAGYSSDNKSRSAHSTCYEMNIPKSKWAYPEDDRN